MSDEDDNKDLVGGASSATAAVVTPAAKSSSATAAVVTPAAKSSSAARSSSSRLPSSSPAPSSFNRFSRLHPSTNLNPPPSNWLHPHPSGADALRGFGAAPTPGAGCFSALWMASRFLASVRQVDVMSDADNIKKLLKLPYSRAPVSLVVHRVGRTLLIDDFDLHGFLMRTSEEEWKWLKSFLFETVFRSLEDRQKALVRRKKTADAIQERNLVSKFLYRSLASEDNKDGAARQVKGDGQPAANEQEDAGEEVEPAADASTKRTPALPLLPEPSLETRLPDPRSSSAAPHEYARNLLWNFEDIRMLIGSDMPIFGDAEHPSVSLRLHSADKPINILTGLDYWLDNLMCQVPEVLMCYHLDGIVQHYELVKTEELPNMNDGCKFSPKVVRDVAKNILSFLKSNATREGHTYWLFKGKDDDVVKLYDLTSLCSSANKGEEKDGDSASKKQESNDDVDMQNPFRTAVSMLLYKVAKSILRGEDRSREGRTAQQLLVKCLHLIDRDKFPHIASSVHFLLSDLYVPDGTNPAEPDFFGSAEAFVDPRMEAAAGGGGLGDPVTTAMSIGMDALRLPPPPKTKMASGGDGGLGKSSATHSTQAAGLKERCELALSHILKGLKSLEYLMERQEADLTAQRKEQEQRERDNLRMAKPFQPIPMGYVDDDPQRKQVEVFKQPDSRVLSQRDQFRQQVAWHDHLKAALLRKAFLVYVTLGEARFAEGKFGAALRCVKRALNCHGAFGALAAAAAEEEGGGGDPGDDAVLSFALSVAGDAYFEMVRGWDGGLVRFQEQYNGPASELEHELAETAERQQAAADVSEKSPAAASVIKLPRDVEEGLSLSRSCLRRSASLLPKDADLSKRAGLHSRLGNVCNELGTMYMQQSQSLLMHLGEEEEEVDRRKVAESLQRLLGESKACLAEGLACFESVGDDTNRAMLHANLGRLSRAAALAYKVMSGRTSSSDAASEMELEQHRSAVCSYERALSALKARKRNPALWDSVRWDFSTALFNLGLELQDRDTPASQEAREEARRQVAECFTRSLKHCDVENRACRERAGQIHLRLGSMYHNALLTAADPTKKSHMRRLAEQHLEKSVRAFSEAGEHAAFLRAQLHRIAIAETSAEQQGETGGRSRAARSHRELFLLMGECVPSLAGVAEEERSSSSAETRELLEMLKLLMTRVQQNLLQLIKFLKKGGGKRDGGEGGPQWAKELYAASLGCRKADDDAGLLAASLAEVIGQLADRTKTLK